MRVPPLQGAVIGISLTGWTALAGMFALVVLVVGSAVWGFRRYTGRDKDGYAVVAKTEPQQEGGEASTS